MKRLVIQEEKQFGEVEQMQGDNMKWDYKIELKDESVFEKIAEKFEVDFPQDLRSFIIKNNGAYPNKNLIKINGVERVFESVLSFNEHEEEGLTVFDVLESNHSKAAIPFGMDPFGNLFFYSLVNGEILFYAHEEDAFVHSDINLEEFLANLY